jgi:hypothetical protein
MSWLRNALGWIEMLLRPKRETLNPSRLMGMYLDQANRPIGSTWTSSGSRERQDGKFAQIRRRSVERLP